MFKSGMMTVSTSARPMWYHWVRSGTGVREDEAEVGQSVPGSLLEIWNIGVIIIIVKFRFSGQIS